MSNKKFWSGLAMLSISILALAILTRTILHKLDVDKFNHIINRINHVVTLVALGFLAVFAYDWVGSRPMSKRNTYMIIYIIVVIILFASYIIGWF